MVPSNDDVHRDWAGKYDDEAEKCQWHGPSVLFGMMYLHVNSGESLLDLGIGTGMGALPFHKAGLQIHGVDSSPAMLEVCRNQRLPFKLTHRDLQEMPWPFADSSFNHIIATGLIHFVSDLRAIFAESARVIKSGGLFGFDYYPYDPADTDNCSLIRDGIYEGCDAEYNHRFYRHSEGYIGRVLSEVGFRTFAEAEFLASKGQSKYFRTLVSRR